jgi:cysteine desulfurase
MSCVGKMAPPTNSGCVTAHAISEAINPRTALVSLSWANALTGVINPIEEISRLCQERGIYLHLDATHVLGKIFIDWEKPEAHFITFNGDNLHAPKGTGGLYIRADAKCSPFILGGVEQAGHRGGSYNMAGLVALGEAAREAIDSRDLICTEVARLRDKLEKGLMATIPEATSFFQKQERLPHCFAMAFPGVANEALLYALNRKNIYASIGGGSSQQIGLVLMASGIPEALANSSLSFALSRETTEDEIDRAIEIIADCVKRMRKVSQFIQR